MVLRSKRSIWYLKCRRTWSWSKRGWGRYLGWRLCCMFSYCYCNIWGKWCLGRGLLIQAWSKKRKLMGWIYWYRLCWLRWWFHIYFNWFVRSLWSSSCGLWIWKTSMANGLITSLIQIKLRPTLTNRCKTCILQDRQSWSNKYSAIEII